MRRLLGSVVSLGICGGMVASTDVASGFGWGGSNSGPKRIMINPDSPNNRVSSGHRFVSARASGSETTRLPQVSGQGGFGGLGAATAGGIAAGVDGPELSAAMRAQLDQLNSVDPSQMQGHGLGGSLSQFAAVLNSEMVNLLSKSDPTGGNAAALACLLPGREQFCAQGE